MERSKFLSLNWRDLLKGLILAVVVALLQGIYNLLDANLALTWRSVLTPPALALIGYLIKNVFENSSGSFGSES